MKLSDLKKGENKPGDCGNPSDQMPEWMDVERFQRGRRLFKRHLAMMMLALHMALTNGFAISNLLGPLVYSNQSNTPIKALKRYVGTAYHILTWHMEDIWAAPDGKGYKSIMTVRNMHNSAARAMNSRLKDKVYISQYDMALVQAGFLLEVLLHHDAFAIRCSREQLEDYVFFWRGAGYMLGIDDKYNMCSNGYTDAYNICKEIENDILIPGLKDKPKDYDLMAGAYIAGVNMNFTLPYFSTDSVMALFASVSGHKDLTPPKLGFIDSLRNLYVMFVLFMVKWFPGFEYAINTTAATYAEDLIKEHMNVDVKIYNLRK